MIQILQDLKMPGSEIDVIVVPRQGDGYVQLALYLETDESTEVDEQTMKRHV